jgi:hypothetical protein
MAGRRAKTSENALFLRAILNVESFRIPSQTVAAFLTVKQYRCECKTVYTVLVNGRICRPVASASDDLDLGRAMRRWRCRRARIDLWGSDDCLPLTRPSILLYPRLAPVPAIIAGMDSHGLTRSQASKLRERLARDLRYMGLLCNPMQSLGFPPADPLYQAAWNARNALQELLWWLTMLAVRVAWLDDHLKLPRRPLDSSPATSR